MIGSMENIFTASKPFITFSRVLGLFPMNFQDASRKGVLKVELSGVVSSSLGICFVTYLIFLNLTENISTLQDAKLMLTVSTILMNFELLSYLFLFGHQLVRRKEYIRFLKLICKVDNEVSTKI